MLIKVFCRDLFPQDFKNDKEYLSTEMKQMLLSGKVIQVNNA